MARPPDAPSALADEYAVDFAHPIGTGSAGFGGAAYAASARESGRTDLMAIFVPRGQPPRADALASETGIDVPGVLMPIDHGRLAMSNGQIGYAVITRAPPGPALIPSGRPLSEAELLEVVLKPAAQALAGLHARQVTHRNIRPDNVFLAGAGARPGVVLGPAWTTPPASLQPPAFDPPYSAMCLPGGRGKGVPADDIYALGVLLLALATGRMPLADLDAREVVRRKLALGSYPALLGEDRLPHAIADLVRGMLAEDPDHRPSAALLTDPVAARNRRLSSRPQRRAARELTVGGESVTDPRSLAYAMACQPGPGLAVLRSGEVDAWLRREIGDSAMAQQVEELQRSRGLFPGMRDSRADPQLLCSTIAVLDRLAPLCWDGIAWWPAATGPALATAAPADAERIEQALAAEALSAWSELAPGRGEHTAAGPTFRQARTLLATAGPAGGRARLLYSLNPLLPCASPALANACVSRLDDVLPALEALAANAEPRRQLPIDVELTAFLAAHADPRTAGNVAALLERPPPGSPPPICQLRVLSVLQVRLQAGPLPGLAAWLQDHITPLLDEWRNKAGRAALEERIRALAKAGSLAQMLIAVEDPAAKEADAEGAERAVAEIAAIDVALRTLAEASSARADYAQRLGQELAVGAGMTALAGALAMMAFG